jgi:DNA-binding PadR family transcriptional regulator
MTDVPLGEFELTVLLAVLQLSDRQLPAFGSAVLAEIRARHPRAVARGAVYVTLDRLQRKGLLASRLAPGPASRAGRPRRLFRVTASGLGAARTAVTSIARMQRGLEHRLGLQS